MADLRPVAAELAAELSERVLVLGSAPGDARDLDLLVREPAEAALRRALPAVGFRPHAGGWLRVAAGTTAFVELEPAAALALPRPLVQRLFEDTRPLEGLFPLALPSPPAQLLLLARRAAQSGGRLDARRLARARAALCEDPDALAGARADAAAWGCAAALELVARELEGEPPGTSARRAALAADGLPLTAAWRDAVRPLVARRRRGVVLAVSGLDGAGKSTLTEGLVQALDALDVPHVVLWHRLSYGRALVLLAAPVKAVLRLARRSHPPTAAIPAPIDSAPSGGGRVWPLVVTLVHAATAGPVTRWHLRRGRVVVRDRYVLDAAVHLADRYGEAAPLRAHLPLLRAALPRPALAWFLDVPAEEAHRRKPEQFSVARLAGQRELYLRTAPALGVRVEDGTRAVEHLRQDAVVAALAVLADAGLTEEP